VFDRYDINARRVIFWARVAAGDQEASSIRPVHLLAGIHREVPDILKNIELSGLGLASFDLSEGALFKPEEASSFSREIPLSESSKHALTLANQTSEKLGARAVGPVHILVGIFKADTKLRQKLQKAKLVKSKLDALCRKYHEPAEEQATAQCIVQPLPVRSTRSGIGYDLHRLVEGRKLILGGFEVPFERGPAGHSDGDVLSHAICDALLGAASLGDIGTHFPDTDPKWKGASSLVFLRRISELLHARHLYIAHIDAIIVAEKPKLGPHFPAMRAALAEALGIKPEQINLKAKTNEGVDAIGRGEAIAAQAIATLEA